MKRFRRQIIAVFIFIFVAGLFALMYRPAIVEGESMMPTYQNGQYVLACRILAFQGPLKHGDVVLVHVGKDVIIKRIAYLPGEILKGREAVRFNSARDYFEAVPESTIRNFQLKVPNDSVVILGDNPPKSDDSRHFGPVPVADILGRVLNPPPAPQ